MEMGFRLSGLSFNRIFMPVLIMLPYIIWANPQGKEMSLEEAIQEISVEYGVYFTYNKSLIEEYTVDFELNREQSLDEAVNQVLSETKLNYRIHASKYVIIYKSDREGIQSLKEMAKHLENLIDLEEKKSEKTLSFLPSRYKMNQTIERKRLVINVSGTITDQSGEPLIGVNVLVKGTDKGTATDFDGKFSLEDVDEEAVLVISYIGYQTQEFVLKGRSNINITLTEDSQTLEEVVVVGYGTSQKKDLTGAVTRVNLDQNRLQPNVNPVQNLRGTVAGVFIMDNGRPGSDGTIRIRGANSISANNNPLIVLDGIIYSGGSLSDINSNDIESIDILKDASASAIYGSLAANGVILITTKKGNTEKPRISLNSYYGLSDFAHIPKYLDAEKYLQVRKDAEQADGGPIPFSPLEQANMEAGRTIEPFEEIRQDAPVYSNELSVSGRGDVFTYYFSGSHTSVKSPVMGDNFQRLGARVNLNVNVTDWLSIGTNSGYSAKDNSGVRADLAMTTFLSPYADLYYDDGIPRPLPMNVGQVRNPLIGTLLYDNLDNTNTLFSNSYIDLTLPLDGLSFRLNTGYTQRNGKAYNYRPTFDRGEFFNLGSGNQSFSESRNFTVENILKYDRVLKKNHIFNATLMYGVYTSAGESASLSSDNIFNDALGYNALEVGENFVINTGAGEDQQLSMMGRLGYRFKGKYIVDATLRRDGYSAFGAGRKYGLFPSAGASWIISEEPFLASIPAVNSIKVRLSWGKNGNRGVSRYSSLSSVSQTNYVFGDGSSTSVGLYTSSIGNPNLGWETTTSTNLGIDFELFSYRVNGSFELYHSKTYDLLLRQSIPNLSGFTSFLRNIGETENRGFELTLNTVNIQKGDFTWDTRIAFTLNRNKILKLTGNDLNGDGLEDDDIASGWFIDYPLASNFDYVFDGIYQDGDTDFDLLPGSKPGDVKFKDVNGDGVITPSDRMVLSSAQPDFLMGITNSFSYKRFSFMVMFNIRQGGESANPAINIGRNFYYESNTLDVPYWTPENPINTNPAINYGNPLSYGFYQSRSYIRLQDVSLSYDLPASILKKIKINNLKLYLSGKNLATWTKWTGWDPEYGGGGRGPGNNGPILKTYTFGLNLQL
ncbi:SusC/RagA family TonB-linked outer membrane protein [Membranihabitans maritimus]|uniref:SusC/RagA family TonB-linked outer membrane protein n=1 Tax=Membranihabitans maritimus TaxID=2904244 RepID=UPI001F0285C3|nr:SusC/RagA family TonB-linked outer membrane protein [Membranihabitans maritimus]